MPVPPPDPPCAGLAAFLDRSLPVQRPAGTLPSWLAGHSTAAVTRARLVLLDQVLDAEFFDTGLYTAGRYILDTMPIDPDLAAQWLLERPQDCAAWCATHGPETVTRLLSAKGPGTDAVRLSDHLERSIREDVFAAACAIARRYMAACEASHG